MGLQHRQAPVVGLQFHPESILTEHGFRFLGNFLRLIGLTPRRVRTGEIEVERRPSPKPTLPKVPVTF
jgi:para-aminobenzoate synthetase component 2